MAQVTVSGNLGFDVASSTTAAGVKTSGNAINTGVVRFTVAEDLGNGLKASAFTEIAMRGRTATTGTSRDAALTLSGGFGSITAGAVEAGNGIVGLGQGGAPVIGLDNGSLLDGGTNVDIITYRLPAFVPGLGLSVSSMDLTGANSQTGSITQVAATYAVGGLSLAADHADFKKFADVTELAGQCAPATGAITALSTAAAACTGGTVIRAFRAASSSVDTRTRISVGYDLGVAKIGYGYQTKSYNTAGVKDNVQTVMGLSIPLGAITVGAVAASNKTDGAATKTTGTEYGASYALSKRTSIAVAAQSWKVTGAASTKATRVRLNHAF
jgi:hypothetical protein